MNRKRFKAEEIVNKLREADVHLSKGQTVAQACKKIGVTGFTYYRCPCDPSFASASHRGILRHEEHGIRFLVHRYYISNGLEITR